MFRLFQQLWQQTRLDALEMPAMMLAQCGFSSVPVEPAMASRLSASHFLIYVLVLHLAHAPIPIWDGDNVVHRGGVLGESPFYDGANADDVWDIDVLLLGVAPPDDLDEGPFRHLPEHVDGSVFGAPYILPRDSGDPPRFQIFEIGRLWGIKTLDRLPDCGRPEGLWDQPKCLGATFRRPHLWRTLLSVIVV